MEEKDSLSNCFPKSRRLLKAKEFRHLSSKAHIFRGKALTIFWKENTYTYPRLGITASKKYGNSVKRNRFKRHVREAFRLCLITKNIGIDINVRPVISDAPPSATCFATIVEDFQAFMQRLASH